MTSGLHGRSPDRGTLAHATATHTGAVVAVMAATHARATVSATATVAGAAFTGTTEAARRRVDPGLQLGRLAAVMRPAVTAASTSALAWSFWALV